MGKENIIFLIVVINTITEDNLGTLFLNEWILEFYSAWIMDCIDKYFVCVWHGGLCVLMNINEPWVIIDEFGKILKL